MLSLLSLPGRPPSIERLLYSRCSSAGMARKMAGSFVPHPYQPARSCPLKIALKPGGTFGAWENAVQPPIANVIIEIKILIMFNRGPQSEQLPCSKLGRSGLPDLTPWTTGRRFQSLNRHHKETISLLVIDFSS